MDKYHKELRDKFELETKTHHDLIGEHHLPSWDYVFWLEDFIHQLQNTSSNNKYTATPKSCTGCKYEPEAECTAECCRHKYDDMYKRA
jgi:hypothetical protein